LVTADGFGSVRALLTARERWAKRAARLPRGRRLRRTAREVVVGAEGRWSLLASPPDDGDAADIESLAEAVAEQLLARWGVVFRDLARGARGVAPHGSARHRARRSFRHWLRGRAVRAPRSGRSAAPDTPPRANRRDGPPVGGGPAEPDGDHHAGATRGRGARQHRR